MVSNTMDPSYWLNWRFLLCAVWVLSSMAVASFLMWKYEGFRTDGTEGGEAQNGKRGTLYEDEAWRPCLRTIHPVWLLVFRVVAFFVFVALLAVTIVVDGVSILFYYTQWTFMLVTIYFGLGLLLSAYGCYQYINIVSGDRIERMRLDSEHSSTISTINCETPNRSHTMKTPMFQGNQINRKIAGFGGYLFQIIYQTNAGAVMLTDFVFWLIIFPFLAVKDYDLNFLQIGMHSINAVFLLGDAALNSLQFSSFRIAYFLLWTSIYVIFQWVFHICKSIWWPYPFLDLSSAHAPIWYFVVAVLHVPCYAVFSLIIKLKHYLLMRWFPGSHYPAS
ncbi:uncharacterized protein LOC110028477 isoform X2 [Phalaenopsis equestris]|nr:uncharacterized protein LOC110028477 isoform X2 [Phalaenopsis equestris]XP_020585998.1 uncharacterized protein LOC110028477 isoform X2 [Phalaenopsis equestris]XP_020585999.1 uncharacterized protein LOC110028477 isoform X2 [Phalaenopsis equestris]XP_020586000.1 uncharacterized protein LOC110028477 isoform X2 [Phalaenopsis equestris]